MQRSRDGSAKKAQELKSAGSVANSHAGIEWVWSFVL